MGLSDPTSYRQTKPGATRLSGSGLIRAIKSLENERQILVRDANSSVADSHHGAVSIALEIDRNTTPRHCVLDGIIYKN